MARGRMIKPEFWTSKRINSVSIEANLLFIALFNFCDDFGTIPNSNRLILGNCFPYRESVTEKHIEKWKAELITFGLITIIDCESRNLICVIKWEKHQTIMNRSKRNNIDNNKSTSEVIETIETLMSDKLDTNYPINNRKEKSDKGKGTSKKEKSPTKLSFGIEKKVKLSQDEYNRLSSDFGKAVVDKKILDLENYLNKGNKYESHNLALRTFFRRDNVEPVKDRKKKTYTTPEGEEIQI